MRGMRKTGKDEGEEREGRKVMQWGLKRKGIGKRKSEEGGQGKMKEKRRTKNGKGEKCTEGKITGRERK